jgi:hypothetical protein
MTVCRKLAVRPEGANHQRRKKPLGELSIELLNSTDPQHTWIALATGDSANEHKESRLFAYDSNVPLAGRGIL